jgi:hypothetical protein
MFKTLSDTDVPLKAYIQRGPMPGTAERHGAFGDFKPFEIKALSKSFNGS